MLKNRFTLNPACRKIRPIIIDFKMLWKCRMQNRLSFRIIGLVLLLGWSHSSLATDLVDAYKDAMRNDPTFKAAEAQFLAATQLLPIKASVLLPQLTTAGSVQRAHIDETFGPFSVNFDQTTTQYQINLNQIIFNLQAWQSVALASDQVKQAAATYNAAAQDLMSRLSNAYFGVLQAYDILRATQAQKQALGQQLNQTQEQFKVGLIAVTGVEQVRANYDTVIATEIANKNAIADKLEELRAITGVFYTHLTGLRNNTPLISPQPSDINDWVKIAGNQNYTIKAAFFAKAAAWENIKVQAAGNFPVVVGNANYSYQYQNPVEVDTLFSGKQVIKQAAVGVSVNFPIYQGGLVTAETRQASFQYSQASAQLEQTYRNVLLQTRESYLGVMTGISKVKADKQAVISGQSSVNSTRAAYNVGTATIVDVLQQLTILYSALSNLAVDQYNYVLSGIALKNAAGTLCGMDMVLINKWLGKDIDFSAYNFNVIKPAYWTETDQFPLVTGSGQVSRSRAKKTPNNTLPDNSPPANTSTQKYSQAANKHHIKHPIKLSANHAKKTAKKVSVNRHVKKSAKLQAKNVPKHAFSLS